MSEPTRRDLLFGIFRGKAESAQQPVEARGTAVSVPMRKPVGSPGSPAGSAGSVRPARAGTFEIAQHLCLAWKNVGCSTCRERCPVQGAIAIDQGRPAIVAAACTGCGDCVRVCPAPILAIRFVPAPRPADPGVG